MPKTVRYFESGAQFERCYVTSEWTMPSKMSINTGVYSTKHTILHPSHFVELPKDIKLMAEYFKEAGYFTTNITGNWRTTPLLGYYRGFDRIIYQNFLGGFDAHQVIGEAIEHLQAFPEKNHFLAVSLMDLHNVPDQIQTHLYSQAQTDISQRLYGNEIGTTSVQTKYDESKVYKYGKEIERVDQILNSLYTFVNEHYDEDEVVVMLHSDHGQSFLESSFDLLSDNRLKVPFLLKGRNVPKMKYAGVTESVDMLPTLLDQVGIPNEKLDGIKVDFTKENHRWSVMTQIIHPKQTYKARIVGQEDDVQFESEGEVAEDLTFELGNVKIDEGNTQSFTKDAESRVMEASRHLWK